MSPVKKTKSSLIKKTKSIKPSAVLSTAPKSPVKNKSKSSRRQLKEKPAPAVEVLRSIKPKRVAQAIAVEVAEDNFSPDLLDDSVRLDKNSDYEINYPFSGADAVETKLEKNQRGENFKKGQENLDKKGKFFNALAEEIKIKKSKPSLGAVAMPLAEEDENSEAELKSFKKSSGLYRRLVIKFILAVAVLVLVVAYFSFSKLTLFITPKTESVGASLEFDVYNQDLGQPSATSTNQLISGKVKELTVSGNKTYPSSGEEVLGEEIVGQVTLINNYNKNQTLVAKTRLLSPDNKLFRLKQAVNIPAGGEVTADIYTDEPSVEMAIAPTRFSIPGLWAGLQDKIYAESEAKFVYQHQIKKYIKPSDLDLAAKDMDNYLIAQAQNQAAVDFGNDEIMVYQLNESQATSTLDAKAGEVKDQFNLSATKQAVLASFSKTQAEELVKAKINLSVPDDKELLSFDGNNIVYTLEKYDPNTKIATVKAEVKGLMSLKGDSEIIDRTKLLNLNQEQIKEYLNNFPEISSYEFKFYPSFINKAPNLVDRIKIQITAPK